jgi:hypothetical protein|tara:strand:- start:757 stop:1176 length:420 start_codon:yes stop_codon:yes gene_type:complete
MNEVEKFEKHTVEVNSTSLKEDTEKGEILFEDVLKFFNTGDKENDNALLNGLVYQKNKDNRFIDTIFKQLKENINNIQTKNNADSDTFLFNTNKKILFNNIEHINSIIKNYDIKEEKILHFILGTLIQYIYEFKERKKD